MVPRLRSSAKMPMVSMGVKNQNQGGEKTEETAHGEHRNVYRRGRTKLHSLHFHGEGALA